VSVVVVVTFAMTNMIRVEKKHLNNIKALDRETPID